MPTFITPQEAFEEIKDDAVVLIDVRTPEEYAQGHIKGARSIPIKEFAARIATELPQKDQRIIVYCVVGVMSAQAADYLTQQGYTNAVSMGGITSWPYEVVKE